MYGECHTRGRQRGYVLLFVMGALVLVASLVTGIGVWVRDRTQSELASDLIAKRDLQLQGQLAAALTKLKLDQHWISRIGAGERAPRNYEVWIPRPEPYRWNFQGEPVDVFIHPMSWFPDINLLDVPALTRLLRALGVEEKDAWHASIRIAAKRQMLLEKGGLSGYSSLAGLWNGDPLPWLGWSGAPAAPGLLWNISLGSKSVDTDPNHTPLAVYGAIYNASPSKLQALQAARARSTIDKVKEREIMGEPVMGRTLTYAPSSVSSGYRVRMVVVPVESGQSPAHGPIGSGIVSISGSQVTLHSQFIFYPH